MTADNKWFLFISLIVMCCFSRGQDVLPVCLKPVELRVNIRPLPELYGDTVCFVSCLPQTFKGLQDNCITDTFQTLYPVLEYFRLLKGAVACDTLRILHIGDSHIRGHIFPQTAGNCLKQTFGAITYVDMGVNGATCLTFTHEARIKAIADFAPGLLILSFGTNESHNRRYNAQIHYHQMDELLTLIRRELPDVPVIITTPPGSYESFRRRGKARIYSVNPRTGKTADTIRRFGIDKKLAVWDLFNIVGGSSHACTNWQTSHLMRPDHIHYMPEGYILQGTLFYQALLNAYNDYVTH